MESMQAIHCKMLQVLDYDKDSGIFTWKERVRKNMTPGTRAGSLNKANGYRYINILGIRTSEHRAAWFYVYGKFPDHTIDHINGNRSDNRFLNLREATRLEQNQNLPIRKNSSGYTGVSWSDSSKKWKAQIRFNNKMKYIGVFNTKIEAHQAYLKEKSEHHKYCQTVRPDYAIKYSADTKKRIRKTGGNFEQVSLLSVSK